MNKRTDELQAGDKVTVQATLNSSAFTATVTGVEPWILTAGPHAGKQATSGRRQGQGEPLLTVHLTDCVVTGPALKRVDDTYSDQADVRRFSAPADKTWNA